MGNGSRFSILDSRSLVMLHRPSTQKTRPRRSGVLLRDRESGSPSFDVPPPAFRANGFVSLRLSRPYALPALHRGIGDALSETLHLQRLTCDALIGVDLGPEIGVFLAGQ